MALMRSLSIGASGLIAQQNNFDVISNNVANSATVGFKGSQATFQEEINLLMRSGMSPDEPDGSGTRGGINPVQYGLGVKIGSIKQDFSQGALESTNSAIDLALDGDGFFIYKMGGSDFYSRAGNLDIDKDGYIVDTATGAYLQGYNVLIEGGKVVENSKDKYTLDGIVGNLRVDPKIQSAPKQTQEMTLSGNLNSLNEPGDTKSSTITIYDQIGNAHEIQITFTKGEKNVDEGFGRSVYRASVQLDGIDVPINGLEEKAIQFSPDGTLYDPQELFLTVEDMNQALGKKSFVDLNPGINEDLRLKLTDPDNALSGITNFSGSNTVTFMTQDGYKPGNLTDISVSTDGTLVGTFTNGRSEDLGQVVVAQFTNQEGLIREGNNFFSESPNSGIAQIGTANEIFPDTSILGYKLEQSNVNLTQEFTEMISAQRAYEAAARVITTSDTILGETTMLKR